MSEDGKPHSWLFVAGQTVLTTVLTTALTLGGGFWLEQRKAKIDLAKEVSQRQADAIDKLDRDLTSLEGNLLYLDKLTNMPNSDQAVQKQAIDAATVMADLFQDNKPLDDSFEAKNAIHELRESLAPQLSKLRENPKMDPSAFRSYYGDELIPKLTLARTALDKDRKRVMQPLP
jgi:hypothetical protein